MATKWLYRGDTVGMLNGGGPRVNSSDRLHLYGVRGKVRGPWPSDEKLDWASRAISDVLLLGRVGGNQAQQRASQLALDLAGQTLQALKVEPVAVEVFGFDSFGWIRNIDRPLNGHPQTFQPLEAIPAQEVDFLVDVISGLTKLVEHPGDPATRKQAQALRKAIETHLAPQPTVV